MLDQRRVRRKLRARNASCIESFDIVGISRQPVLFYRERPLDQVFYLLLSLGIGRAMRCPDKTVIGVFSRIQHSHSIKLMEQNCGEHVIYGEGVIGVSSKDLIELLYGSIVIKIVKVVVRHEIERVSRPE
jgi:hypothetical protein